MKKEKETKDQYEKRLMQTISDVADKLDATNKGANYVVLSSQLAPILQDMFDSTYEEDYNIRAVANRIRISIDKDRLLYLKEVQKITGYKINSIAAIRNDGE